MKTILRRALFSFLTLFVAACCLHGASSGPIGPLFIPDGGSLFGYVPSTAPLDWTTAYDLDFSAQGTQSLSTDTTYTIDGKVWTKQNSTNDNTAMALTNGSGVVIIPKSTSDYNGATRTLPLLCLPILSVIPTFDRYSQGLRVWIYTSSTNYAASFDSVSLSIDTLDSTYVLDIKNGFNTTGQGQSKYIGTNNVNTSGFVNSAKYIADNVQMLQADLVWGIRLTGFSGTYSSGWPAISAMHSHASATLSNPAQGADAGQLPLSTCIGAQRAASGTALSVTIARIRWDWKKS